MNAEKTAGADPAKKSWAQKHPIWTGIIGVLVIGFTVSTIAGGAGSMATAPAQAPAEEVATDTQSTLSKEDAQKELDHIMDLSKQANFALSYDFSNTGTVVYAGPAWYTQSVAFKKDFLAKVGALKKVITGYQHFEVRDANSNEKVGEITAFSGSLEVYK